MLTWTPKAVAGSLICASLLLHGCEPAEQSPPPPAAEVEHDHEHEDHDHEHEHDDHDHDKAEAAPAAPEMKTPAEKPAEAPAPEATPAPAAEPAPALEAPAKPAAEAEMKKPAETPAEKPAAPAAPAEPAAKPAPETSKTEMKKPESAPVELAKAEPAPKEAAKPAAEQSGTTGDWPMWGGDPTRNMINKTTGISLDFEPALEAADGKKLIFTSKLGSQTYGNPIVANGKVFVGTNNGGEYRPQHKGDRGCVLCFDDKTGEFLWQLTREKLQQGRVNDWPEQGICSSPCVEGNFVYVVTNRCEVMCLDINGFRDGENNGPYTEEVDADPEDADIIWSLDMIEEYGVFPHNLATSSPVIYGDNIYVVTSNGVDEAHLEIPSPRSPSFMCLNKKTGEVIWDTNDPFDGILHGQWSSPAIGIVNGVAQVYMPGGDGWLYTYNADNGELIWKFDLNPKDSKWELGGRGTRNNIISTPVFLDNSVILSVGQDPEHGEGVGHIYRIDCTKTGDVSPVTENNEPNPNSAQIWHFGGVDTEGTITGRKNDLIFRRTISTVAISNGLVYAPDLSGFLHCLDFKTGERYWEYDSFAAIWGSPMVVDGKVFLGDEDGDMVILAEGKEEKILAEKLFDSSIYSTPTIANGKMYISDRSRLYCFDIK